MYILAKYLALLDHERRTFPEGDPERAAAALLRVWIYDHQIHLKQVGEVIARAFQNN